MVCFSKGSIFLFFAGRIEEIKGNLDGVSIDFFNVKRITCVLISSSFRCFSRNTNHKQSVETNCYESLMHVGYVIYFKFNIVTHQQKYLLACHLC